MQKHFHEIFKKTETDEEKSQGMVKIVNEDNQEYFDFDESATFQSMNLEQTLINQKKILMKKCYFPPN